MMGGDRLVGGDNHVNLHVVRTNGDFARGEHLFSERQPDLKDGHKRLATKSGRRNSNRDCSPKRGFAVPRAEASDA